MKQCIKCNKQVPDTAMHCVFCGTKQPVEEQQTPATAKTVMGYAAADVLRELKAQQEAQAAAKPAAAPAPAAPAAPDSGFGPPPAHAPAANFGPPAAHAPAPGPAAPAVGFGPPAAHAPAPAPAPAMIDPSQQSSATAATLYAPASSLGPSAPAASPPPAAAPQQQGGMPAHMAKTMAASVPANLPPMAPATGAAPQFGQMAPGQMAPGYPPSGPSGPGGPGGQPAPGYPQSGAGYPPGGPSGPGGQPAPGYPQSGPGYPQSGQGMGMGMGAPASAGMTAQVAPQQPPYLASQTPTRMGAPQEPWAGSLETLMLIFGIGLVLCFLLPWTLAPKTTFSWNIISDASGKHKLPPLLIAGTGVLAVILSRLSLSVSARGIAAIFLGFTPVALLALLLSAAPISLGAPGGLDKWKLVVLLVSSLTLVSGLLLRSEYHTSMLPRLMVTIGVAALLIPFLVSKPSIIDAFKAIGEAPGKHKLQIIVGLMPVVLAVVGLLLTWLPTDSASGTHIIAWLLIIWTLVASLIALALAEGSLGPQIKAGLLGIFWLPITAMAWTALTGYGVATVLGKSLEHN